MTASTKLSGQTVAIDCAATAEAELKASRNLFDKDNADFGSTNGQSQIDGIFCVWWKGTGFRKVFFQHMRVNQLAIKFRCSSR